MLFLSNFNIVSDSVWIVGNVHYRPFDEKDGLGETKEALEEQGVLYEGEIPAQINQEGMQSDLAYNPIANELFWHLQSRPLTQEEKQAQKINDLEGAVMELTMIMSMMGGM